MEEKDLILRMIKEGKRLLEKLEIDSDLYTDAKKEKQNSNSVYNDIKRELNSFSDSITKNNIPEKIVNFFSDKKMINKKSSYTKEYENINKMIFEFIVTSVLIKRADVKNVTIKIYSDQDYNKEDFEEEFKTTVEDGLLKMVQMKQENYIEVWGIQINNMVKGKSYCEILIPKDVELDFISLYTATGLIEASDILTEKITLSSTASSVLAENLNSNKLILNSKAGSIDLKNSKILNYIEIDTKAGSINIRKTSSNTLTAKTNAGSIDIYDSNIRELVGTTNAGGINILRIDGEPYKYTLSSNVGGINLDSQNIKNMTAELNIGSFLGKRSYSTEFDLINKSNEYEKIVKGSGEGFYAKLSSTIGKITVN